MPQLETALYAYLSTEVSLAALVDDRIYPFRLPEGASLPAIAWQRISAQRTYTFDAFGTSGAYVRARVQFACWAETPLEAIDVGEALLGALSGYSGDMEGELIGSSTAQFEFDDYESQTRLYRRLVDFFITYEDDVLVS